MTQHQTSIFHPEGELCRTPRRTVHADEPHQLVAVAQVLLIVEEAVPTSKPVPCGRCLDRPIIPTLRAVEGVGIR